MPLHRITIAFLGLYAILTLYSIISFIAGFAPWRLLTPITTLTGFTFARLHAGQLENWR
jgi:hypothetical protein